MDEIVRNLSRCRSKNAMLLKEGFANHRLSEAEEDEEDINSEEEVDTEVAGTTEEETPEIDDIPGEEETAPSEEELGSEADSTPADSESAEEYDDEYVDPDGDTEAENAEEGESDDNHEYVNPLDNPHAVKHTIGEEVLLAYSNGTNSKLKGEIEGYDKEGFYRILWSNGMTTDGITDAALSNFLDSKKESKCVCGNTEFVTEGKHVVCDSCGRKIREAKQDPLTVADKMRPAGKRMIRSEAHPISTSLSETIKKAFKSQRKSANLKEDSEVSMQLSKLKGQFWTRQSEMVEDIEELGYEVIDYNSEYVVLAYTDEDGDEGELQIPIVGTSRTMTLDLDRIRFMVGMDME